MLHGLARTLQKTNEDFYVIQETYAKWYENTYRFIQLKIKKKNHRDSSLRSQVLHPTPRPVRVKSETGVSLKTHKMRV